MPLPSRTELLSFMARHEPFEKTLARFPEVSLVQLRALLREAALLMRAEEEGAPESSSLDQSSERAPVPSAPRESASQREAGPPPAKLLKLYSDGAARGNPGPAGAGAVLIKTDGTVVARCGKFLGSQTNNYAEYVGLLIGLETALRLGANEIEIRADSELLVRQMLGIYKVKNAGLKELHQKAKDLLKKFRKVKLEHVPREQNQLADEMSNRAIDERM
jgi:ribonuclease HI